MKAKLQKAVESEGGTAVASEPRMLTSDEIEALRQDKKDLAEATFRLLRQLDAPGRTDRERDESIDYWQSRSIEERWAATWEITLQRVRDGKIPAESLVFRKDVVRFGRLKDKNEP